MCFERRQLAFAVCNALLLVSRCYAQAWKDFSVTMPNGYEFVRCNSIDTVICPPESSSVIFSPNNFERVGPIREFATTNKNIFLHNVGRKPRNLFVGDEFQEVDETQDFYFIISTRDDSVTGPLSRTEFEAHQLVNPAGNLNWKTPVDPMGYFCMAMFGSFAFLPLILRAIAVWRRRATTNKTHLH